ncbi:hypothetical protein M0811_10887 [Anaeramoeba ignava]|uniref:THH1/TOM1/TOM3 domain-containing protein n=1 Tax=Anaeramoeba ignava TaxID=1746090 RepID=A0A9Q0LFR3_ANAIG|nr:hypothetical protein M0811_10887 [Anaeramoeba ignava]
METPNLIVVVIFSIIYFAIFIIALIRWILLLKRTKQFLHQKIFFFLIWLFCLVRIITLITFSIKRNFSDNDLELSQTLEIEINILNTAYLLIIFALNQFKAKNFLDDPNAKRRKKMLILIFIIFDIIFITIHVTLVFENFGVSEWILVSSFVIVSIGFLIYSVKLSKNSKDSEDSKQLKKMSIIFGICTFFFVIRIPFLLFLQIKGKTLSSTTIALINIFYGISELVPLIFITFYIFQKPIKSVVMESINLQLLQFNAD